MTTKYRLTAADRITEANDKGDFDAAWQALDQALAHGRGSPRTGNES